ncbi:universal stress protein [Catellatospora sichuanensis]|uniref:universal stress protein n=1 Tax=Catellatospora sichuanensis TaxID=1969805 RepID=UPI00164334E3|nr:universal stress protein [Catellatospora sichuanensis]
MNTSERPDTAHSEAPVPDLWLPSTVPGPVSVGVDGSAASHRALLWAAQEARLRRVHLNVVFIAKPHLPPPLGEALDHPSGYVQHLLSEAGDEVGGCAARLDLAGYSDVTATVALGWDDPVDGLARAAAGSTMMVVGDHEPAGIRALLLGSSALRTAEHASCPVAVVRARPRDPHPSAHDDRVMVGIDGSASSVVAAALAFEEAHLRDIGLTAVHVWYATPQEITAEVAWGGNPGPQPDALALLEHVTAPGRLAHPDVDVRHLAVMGQPATALTELSSAARMLVVGSGGHGTVAERLLGSTGKALVHHAHCPVLIVPTHCHPQY